MVNEILKGVYLCRNQSQFRDSIKVQDWFTDEPLYMYQCALESGLVTYPKSYPCIVTFTKEYYGYHYPCPTIRTKDSITQEIYKLNTLLEHL